VRLYQIQLSDMTLYINNQEYTEFVTTGIWSNYLILSCSLEWDTGTTQVRT
jgi:hypothetical protein